MQLTTRKCEQGACTRVHADTRTGDAEAASPTQAAPTGRGAAHLCRCPECRPQPAPRGLPCGPGGVSLQLRRLQPFATGREPRQHSTDAGIARLPLLWVMDGVGRVAARPAFHNRGRRVWLSISHAELLASVSTPMF